MVKLCVTRNQVLHHTLNHEWMANFKENTILPIFHEYYLSQVSQNLNVVAAGLYEVEPTNY